MFEGIVIVFVSVFALVLYFPQLLNVFFLADLNICSETGEGAGAGCRSCAELVGSDSEMPDLRTPPTLPTNARLIFRRHVKGGGKQGGVPGVPGDGDGQLPSRKWCQPTTGQPYKTNHIQNGSSKKNGIFAEVSHFKRHLSEEKSFSYLKKNQVFPQVFFA